MKIKKGFELRQLGTDHILSCADYSSVDFNKIVAFNSTAAFLWKKVEQLDSFTAEDVCRFLIEEYEIDNEVASRDAEKFLSDLKSAGVVID